MKMQDFIKRMLCKHKWICIGSKTIRQIDSCDYIDTFKCVECGKSKTEKWGWSR